MNYDEIITRWNAQADEHNQWDELGEDEKIELAFACGTSAVPAQPTRQELEAQLSAGRGRGGTAAQAPAASAEICVSALMFKISTLIDKRVNCDPCAEAEADLLYFLRTMLAVAPQAVQAAVPVDVEVLRNLITRAISSKTSHHINAAKATFTRDGKKGTALGELVDAIAEDLVAHFAAAPAHPAERVPAPAAVAVADERAAFEAWAKSENMNISSDCDGYIHADTAVASMAWQARAAFSATQPAAQVLDAQTIKHISALSELVRMPNAEHFADAHNAAVRHLRTLAAQAKQGDAA